MLSILISHSYFYIKSVDLKFDNLNKYYLSVLKIISIRSNTHNYFLTTKHLH